MNVDKTNPAEKFNELNILYKEQTKDKNAVILVNRKTGAITSYTPKEGKIPIFDRVKVWFLTTFKFDRTIEHAMAKAVKTEFKHIIGQIKEGKEVDQKVLEEAKEHFAKLPMSSLSIKTESKLANLSKESQAHLDTLHAYSDLKAKLSIIEQKPEQEKITAVNDFINAFSTSIDKLDNNEVLKKEIIGKMQETLTNLLKTMETTTNSLRDDMPDFNSKANQKVSLTEWKIKVNTQIKAAEEIRKNLFDNFARPRTHFDEAQYSQILQDLNFDIVTMRALRSEAFKFMKSQAEEQLPSLLKQSEEAYSKAKKEMMSHPENNAPIDETLLSLVEDRTICIELLGGKLDANLSKQITDLKERITEESGAPLTEARNFVSDWKAKDSSSNASLQLLERAQQALSSPFGKEIGMLIGTEMKQEAHKLREQSNQTIETLEKEIHAKESQLEGLLDEAKKSTDASEKNKLDLERFAAENDMNVEIGQISTFSEKIVKKINEEIDRFQKQASGLESLINERNQLAKEVGNTANEFLQASVKKGNKTAEFQIAANTYDQLLVDLQKEMEKAGVEGNPLHIQKNDLILFQVVREEKFDKEMALWKEKIQSGKATLPDHLLKEMEEIAQGAKDTQRLVALIQKRDKVTDPDIIGYVVNIRGARIHSAKGDEFRAQLQEIQKKTISRAKALQVIQDMNYSKEKLGKAEEMREHISRDREILDLRKQELSRLQSIEENLT